MHKRLTFRWSPGFFAATVAVSLLVGVTMYPGTGEPEDMEARHYDDPAAFETHTSRVSRNSVVLRGMSQNVE